MDLTLKFCAKQNRRAVLYANLKSDEFKSLTMLLMKYGAQVTIITAASCVSLSRITDNAHHWSDVLVGTIAGVLEATTFVTVRTDKEEIYGSRENCEFGLGSTGKTSKN
uniref:Phosphatidic acid phosphatase type 2/haloperoxidase domain-containing protein n=1 Tax=Romanomermis culicivorax TaxID=13658 RepID=A0A915K0Z3_ROMCU